MPIVNLLIDFYTAFSNTIFLILVLQVLFDRTFKLSSVFKFIFIYVLIVYCMNNITHYFGIYEYLVNLVTWVPCYILLVRIFFLESYKDCILSLIVFYFCGYAVELLLTITCNFLQLGNILDPGIKVSSKAILDIFYTLYMGVVYFAIRYTKALYFKLFQVTKGKVLFINSIYLSLVIICIHISFVYMYSPARIDKYINTVAVINFIFLLLVSSIVLTNMGFLKQKRLLDELEEKNKKLKEYAATIEELSVAKERNRFARDAHDTLGHTMALLVALLETGVGEIDSSNKLAKERVGEALQLAKEGLTGLRQSVSGLAFKEVRPDRLVHMLETLSTDFEATGIHIDLSIDGVLTCSDPRYSESVYRICREALTNSARHGKASSITVVLRFHDDAIKLFIIDDGIGCKKIKKGLGLSGMEHAVAELGGELHYGSDGEKGFSINVEIPVNQERFTQ